MKVIQKQLPKGVPGKRYSENMPQMYRRKSMSKCDFNKVSNITRFFISNTFLSNVRLKRAKNQASAKQQPEAKRL